MQVAWLTCNVGEALRSCTASWWLFPSKLTPLMLIILSPALMLRVWSAVPSGTTLVMKMDGSEGCGAAIINASKHCEQTGLNSATGLEKQPSTYHKGAVDATRDGHAQTA